MIVAVGPEAVGDLVVASPRVHVREHRQVVAVDEFGVRQLLYLVAESVSAAIGEPLRRSVLRAVLPSDTSSIGGSSMRWSIWLLSRCCSLGSQDR